MLDYQEDIRDVLYVYDKLNAYKVVQDAQEAFRAAGPYFNSNMRCIVFPLAGRAVLDWLVQSKRIIMMAKADFEGAHTVEPLLIPDDL